MLPELCFHKITQDVSLTTLDDRGGLKIGYRGGSLEEVSAWSLPGMEVILGYETNLSHVYTLTNNQWLFR